MADKSSITGNNEKFYKVSNSDGTVSFSSKANDKYLSADINVQGQITVEVPWNKAWEHFELEYK